MENKDSTEENNLERGDTRAEEGHPVATGVGALGGGAAGAAIGTAVGGPVGTVVGAVIGAVAGGAGGYAVGEAIDPAAEDAYWRENHYKQPFAKSGSFDKYQGGYRTGYEGWNRYGAEKRSFTEAESDLERDYGRSEADLPWSEARNASRAAWTRVERGEAARVPITDDTQSAQRIGPAQGTTGTLPEGKREGSDLPVERRREEATTERAEMISNPKDQPID